MRLRREETLRRWLAAEAEASAPDAGGSAAEQALRELFEALPLPSPTPGFTERVLARAGVLSRAPGWFTELLASRPFKGFVAACVLLAGSVLLAAPGALSSVVGRIRLAEVLRWLSEGLLAVFECLRGGIVFWEILASLGAAAADAVATPRGAAALATSLVVSTLAFRLLQGLITRDRSWSHAETA